MKFVSPFLYFYSYPSRMVLSVVGLAMTLTFGAVSAQAAQSNPEMSAEEIIARFVTSQATFSEMAFMRMTSIKSDGKQEQREFFSISQQTEEEDRAYLVRMISPPSVYGISLLARQKPDGGRADQYLYQTDLGRAREIRDTQRNVYFLASDFTYEDLLREIPENFKYVRMDDQLVQGRACYVVRATATEEHSAKTGYAYRDLYILADETLNLQKIDFFAPGDKLEKTLEAFDYEAGVDGPTQRPRRTMMTNHSKGTKTVLEIIGHRVNLKIDGSLLTPEGISKWPDEQDSSLLKLFKQAEKK